MAATSLGILPSGAPVMRQWVAIGSGKSRQPSANGNSTPSRPTPAIVNATPSPCVHETRQVGRARGGTATTHATGVGPATRLATLVDCCIFVNYCCYMATVERPDVRTPADALAAVLALRRLADQLEDVGVEQALRAGWSWPEVAEALGVTRQAVHKKHAKRLIAAGVTLRRR